MKPEFILDIIVAIASFILSLCALIISIISIKKQNQNIEISSSLQLYKLRFDIYSVIGSIYENIIFLSSTINLHFENKNFSEIIDTFQFTNEPDFIDIKHKMTKTSENVKEIQCQFDILFKKDLAEELSDIATSYIVATFLLNSEFSTANDAVERKFFELLDYDFRTLLKEISKYIDFSNICLSK